MRTLHRGIVAGLLSAPLVLGVSGVAGAADYNQHQSTAGPQGAEVSQTQSHAPGQGQGQASYEQNHSSAGKDGDQSSGTHSNTGSHEDNGGLLSILL